MAPSLRERLGALIRSRRPDPSPTDQPPEEGASSVSPELVDATDDARAARRAEPVVAEQEQPEVAEVVAPDTPVVQPPSSAASGFMTPRFLMVVVGIAAMGLSLTFIRELASVIAPLFFGLNLMITVHPVYRWLRRKRIPAGIASTVAGLIVFAVLTGFILGLSYSVTAMVNYLPRYTDQFTSLYVRTIESLSRLGFSEDMLLDRLKGIDPQSLVGVLTSVLSETRGIASLLLVLVTALIFMVMDTPGFEERMAIARSSHGVFIGALEHFATGIRKYWVVTTIFGLIVAILDLAVLIGLGVPLALIWALFSFLTNYIPNIGFVIGVIPPALLALFEKGPKTAIAVLVAYSVLNFVVQSIIQPKFAGDAVGLSPTLSFISLLLWTSILGALGALLALPSSLLVKALLIDADPRARWVNALISSRPADAIAVEPDRR
ncbi:AI-2E family transporter [Aestuariimicrobium ganziense]|uniref:AI-2E family transporter n=1 Tax=Aestuariimicrobium ganziense TaxID=2773677 RepID=UPI001942C479|nr:AI-2E family transporter [Aestuariimicrobium ganziense]